MREGVRKFVNVVNAATRINPKLFGVGVDTVALKNALSEKSNAIEEKADKTLTSLREDSSNVSDLMQSIENEISKIENLKLEYEKYKNLASLSEDQSKALLEQLSILQSSGRGRERWVGLIINIIAGFLVFLLGIFLAPYFNI